MQVASPFQRIMFLLVALLITLPLYSAPQNREDDGKVVTYAAWSPTALYFAFRVDDPMIVGNQTLWLGQPWQDDAIAVYLNLGNDDTMNEQTVRVVLSAAGGATVQRGSMGEWRDDPIWFDPLSPKGTIRFAINPLDNGKINDNSKPDHGYQAELGLSWDLLGVNPPIRSGQRGQLPTIRFAIVNYSQGETQAISCWPERLRETDLQNPATWGALQFNQSLTPKETQGETAFATRIPGDAHIDGKLDAFEWMTAGVINFTKHWGETVAPVKRGKLSVSLVAASYSLDPYATTVFRRPFDVAGPWNGPDSPHYHLQQIREARRAGIDMFAVQLSAESALRDQQRRRLLALRTAEERYAGAIKNDAVFDVPLLMPIIDLAHDASADRQAIIAVLQDFYRIVPPQYRVMVPNDQQQWCTPVMLANPPQGLVDDVQALPTIMDTLHNKFGITVGWILDSAAWKEDGKEPGVLSYCAYSTTTGMQLGNGSLLTALVMPGMGTASRDLLLRRNGETFDNGWFKVYSVRPDFVLLRSWNDFASGTEIVATQSEGSLYLDELRLDTMRLAKERGSGICVLRHTLPATLTAGISYPVDILIKNGGLQKIVSTKGCRVTYRVLRDDATVLSGEADSGLVLMELSAAQIHLTLPTSTGKTPLVPGEYTLQLDFVRNKLPYVATSLLQSNLGTVSIPFTIAQGDNTPQVLNADLPESVQTGAKAEIAVSVRNLTRSVWRKGEGYLQIRWQSERGEALPGQTTLSYKRAVERGAVVSYQGTTPDAPDTPGWYHLSLEYTKGEGAPVSIYSGLVQVKATDFRAEIQSIQSPTTVGTTKDFQVAVLVKNCGQTAWTSKNTTISYQWLTWDGRIIPKAQGYCPVDDDVASGEKAIFHAQIPTPGSAGSFRCAFGLRVAGAEVELATDPADITNPVVPITVDAARYQSIDLTDACGKNDVASYADTALSRGDFDGAGNAFPQEEFLPDTTSPLMGYQPGYHLDGSATAAAPSFRFPSVRNDQTLCVRARGQKITLLPQHGTKLYFVATSTQDPHPVTFSVRYADNPTVDTKLSIANWMGDPVDHEPIMLKTRHLHTLQGDNWYLYASLFVYSIQLDPKRIPQELILPNSPDIALFAVTQEMVERPQQFTELLLRNTRTAILTQLLTNALYLTDPVFAGVPMDIIAKQAMGDDSRIPDVLKLKNGKNVTTAKAWQQRRAELLDAFRTNVYGRAPIERPKDLQFVVNNATPDVMDGTATRKQVTIRYSGPGGNGSIDLLLFIPKNVTKPAPTFLFICNRGVNNIDPTRQERSPFWPAEAIVARGYVAAAFYNGQLAKDDETAFQSGAHAIFDTERHADSWGTLSSWAWGASRVLDYMETDSDIDSKRVAIVGHSRGGKTALWCGAQDERFAMVVSNDSGCTGAAITRQKTGEKVADITAKFPYWFCENYKQFSGHEDRLPVDQHELLALIAPRPLYIASASEDLWSDPESEFLSCVAADPVYKLLGKPGLGITAFPQPEQPIQAGNIAYHLRTGPHDLTLYDWQQFMNFADVHLR